MSCKYPFEYTTLRVLKAQERKLACWDREIDRQRAHFAQKNVEFAEQLLRIRKFQAFLERKMTLFGLVWTKPYSLTTFEAFFRFLRKACIVPDPEVAALNCWQKNCGAFVDTILSRVCSNEVQLNSFLDKSLGLFLKTWKTINPEEEGSQNLKSLIQGLFGTGMDSLKVGVHSKETLGSSLEELDLPDEKLIYDEFGRQFMDSIDEFEPDRLGNEQFDHKEFDFSD